MINKSSSQAINGLKKISKTLRTKGCGECVYSLLFQKSNTTVLRRCLHVTKSQFLAGIKQKGGWNCYCIRSPVILVVFLSESAIGPLRYWPYEFLLW